ncbi:hypothetical protein B5C34_09515 [Pacificimonas flava]|uniref:Uncharacterized protein n=2 Tax=Pacificimonas TaxID=1960290 RepID=A0A219B6D4_9SPHN|nr:MULTISPECIES: hypothetical protein [Pacificimonas]MBZ6379090.1 hypothetical protein [Pacificimonas aurantium]OWV33676.1 hypothetical protein B5C34_09515 [Pacificimonas flava]
MAIRVVDNNLGGGTLLDHGIYLKGTAAAIAGHEDIEDVFIEGNTFGRTADGGGNYDIYIADEKVRYTMIGRNRVRGIGPHRGDQSWSDSEAAIISANTLDPSELLRVFDGGLGTYGIWKAASALSLQNGWGAGQCRFRKTIDDVLQWDGNFGGTTPTLAANTVIGTLPEGFRPRVAQWVRARVASEDCMLKISTTGDITIVTPPSGSAMRIVEQHPVKGRIAYDPGH